MCDVTDLIDHLLFSFNTHLRYETRLAQPLDLLGLNPESHMTAGISRLDRHGRSKAWHELDADSHSGKKDERQKKKLRKQNWIWEVNKRLRMFL